MTDPRRKDLTFTLTGHAHLDPVWLWDQQEGIETVKATFRSALDRLKENPDLVFTHTSAAQYAWMQIHPQLTEEIRDAVRRGQWELSGGLWVEPDVNIPCGEALARQGLYGQRFFRQTFGKHCTIAFLPDSFGHPQTLPQILRHCALTSFVFWRPHPHEVELPSNLFWWQGSDGSRILSARLESYNSNPRDLTDSLNAAIGWRPTGSPEWLVVYGVGNHGGGPTKKALAHLRDLMTSPDWPTLQFGTLEGFFERAHTRDHPTFDAALQHTFRGCYTSHSQVKQLNRQAEHALACAEKWSTVAQTFGQPYPKEPLERAWKHLLFNQFHDIICGTSIPRAYDDVRFELSEAIGTARRATHRAQQVIAQRIDTRSSPDVTVEETMRRVRTGAGNAVADLGDGVPVVVFNSSPCPRREVIDVELNDWHIMDLRVQDEQQRPIVHQLAQGEAGPPRKRVAFLAEVPPLGYRVYRVTDRPPQLPGPNARPLCITPTVIENSWWRLEFDVRTGALRSLRDQQLGRELLAGAGAQLLVIEDPSNPWGKGAYFRHLAGVFGEPELSVLESGPVRATIRVTTRWGHSSARHDFTLFRDIPAIHGRLQLDWHEEYRMVKLAFPLALEDTRATFSVPFGHTERPAGGQEEPSQAWLNVNGSLAGTGRDTQANVQQLGDEAASMADAPGKPLPYGVALLNDGKYGADVHGGELRLSILRSPIYGGGDRPEHPRPVDEYLDQGVSHTRWALMPHAGDWQDHAVVQAAQDFNEPLSFVREYAHEGDLPPVRSFLSVEPAGAVIVTALKVAEEGEDLILRLYEPHCRTAPVRITLPLVSATLKFTLGPHEIKTLRVAPDGSLREVNFLEEDFA